MEKSVVTRQIMPFYMLTYHTNILDFLDKVLKEGEESSSSMGQSQLPPIFKQSVLNSHGCVPEFVLSRKRLVEIMFPIEKIFIETVNVSKVFCTTVLIKVNFCTSPFRNFRVITFSDRF